MNKRIKGWFAAVFWTELTAALFEVVVFFGNGGSSPDRAETAYRYVSTTAIMFCAGIWLPLLFAFIGICIETKYKRIKPVPIATGLSLALSAGGLIGLQFNRHTGFMFSGWQDIPRELFYMICGGLSFFLFLAAIFRADEIKKKKYAEFLAAPDTLFEGKSVLMLIPLTVLTVVCAIPAVCGYIESIK